MQQMTIYWRSVIPQHALGVFTPIIRRADCVSLPVVSCPGCGCRGSGELGGLMATSSSQCTHLATRLSRTTTATTRTGNRRQWHAVCSPDDGRNNARNVFRNNWWPINCHLLRLVGLAFIYCPLCLVSACMNSDWKLDSLTYLVVSLPSLFLFIFMPCVQTWNTVITTATIILCQVSLYFLAGESLWDFTVEVNIFLRFCHALVHVLHVGLNSRKCFWVVYWHLVFVLFKNEPS